MMQYVISLTICSQDYINWHLLPHADSEVKSKASLIQGRFTGDPSFDYEYTITHRIGVGDALEETNTVVSLL